MSGAAKWGSEFLVNTTTAGVQAASAVTGLADGCFVVTWTDGSQSGGDASSAAVRGQVFNADGSKAGGEFLVNTTTSDAQQAPTITALDDGRFVASWQDASHSGGDTDGTAIRAQAFNPDGSKSGTELLVNTTTTGGQVDPAIAALADGRIVVSWSDASADAGDIRAQVFNADGTPSGVEFLVSTSATGEQSHPAITGLAGPAAGRFVVSWTDASMSQGDASGLAVRAQVYEANGTKVGTEFVLAANSSLDQFDPSIAGLSDGRFVATWTDTTFSFSDPFGYAVRGQLFSADGARIGGEFLVNTTTAGHQNTPAVAALADGGFVVAWTDASGSLDDASGQAIRAQVYDVNGAKSGFEFLVNTITTNAQVTPSVAALADGRFVVTWTDSSQAGGDADASAIHSQIFDPRGHAVHLDGTALHDDLVGTGFDDTMGGSGGNDHLAGAAGSDKLDGGIGNDSLEGGLANDTLDGGAGNDTMAGGGGDDTYTVDSPGDVVSEQAGGGSDTVNASVGYTLGANVETLNLTGAANINGTGNGLDNTIYGNDGANLLSGMAGNDTLIGGAGADTFVGGAGKDLMTGGGGLDHFNFTSLLESGTTFAVRDVINTFAHGDKVDLSALDANSAVAGNQAFTFVDNFSHVAGQLEWTQTAASGYLIQGDVNGDGAADFSLQIYAAPGFGTIHNWDFIL